MAFKDMIPWKWGKGSKLPVRRINHDPLYGLQTEVNRMFDDFFRHFDHDWGIDRLPFRYASDMFGGSEPPRLNVSETDKQIEVTAELPGVDEKDVDVSITDGELTIKGEKKLEKEEKEKDYYHVERSYGSFSRTVPLTAEVDTDKVDASYHNGVLTIKLPKTATAQSNVKRIVVKKS